MISKLSKLPVQVERQDIGLNKQLSDSIRQAMANTQPEQRNSLGIPETSIEPTFYNSKVNQFGV